MIENLFQSTERQNMSNQTFSESDDEKQNVLATLVTFLSQLKSFMKNLGQHPKLALLNFLAIVLTE